MLFLKLNLGIEMSTTCHTGESRARSEAVRRHSLGETIRLDTGFRRYDGKRFHKLKSIGLS